MQAYAIVEWGAYVPVHKVFLSKELAEEYVNIFFLQPESVSVIGVDLNMYIPDERSDLNDT